MPPSPAPDNAPLDCHGHCPNCRYDQRGLPARHRCPECGFAFDEHTRIWRQRQPLRAIIAIIVAPMYLLCCVSQPIMQALEASMHRRYTTPILLMLLLGMPTLIGLSIWRLHRRGCYIALAPAGLFARTLQGDFFVPFAEVAMVSRYELWIKQRGVDVDISMAGIVRRSELDSFMQALTAAQVRATSATAS